MLRSSQVKSPKEEEKVNYYLLPVLDPTGSFLTMSASEFISNLWNSYRTYLQATGKHAIGNLNTDQRSLKQKEQTSVLTLILQNLYPSWFRVTMT